MIKRAIENYLARPRHRGKTRVVRFLLRLLRLSSVRSHYGPILCCRPGDRTNVYAIAGDYGHVISDHIKSLPPGDSFIDIGANYGLFTFMAAARLADGKVYAFEPNPEIFPFLESARRLNGADNVTLFNFAVGEQDGTAQLGFDARHSGVSRLLLSDSANTEARHVTVKVMNIASSGILKELGEAPALHIKIDVEGYEAEIIEMLRLAPWFTKVKSIIVEIDENNLKKFGASGAAIYTMLAGAGFRPRIGHDEIRHYDEIFVRPQA